MTLGKKANKILYIDCLDYISLFLAIIMKPFYHGVYFHSAIKIFQSKRVINNLKLFGICWLDFHQVPLHIWAIED